MSVVLKRTFWNFNSETFENISKKRLDFWMYILQAKKF